MVKKIGTSSSFIVFSIVLICSSLPIVPSFAADNDKKSSSENNNNSQSSLAQKPSATTRFLKLPPLLNDYKISEAQFKYDLSNPERIQLGPIALDATSMAVEIYQKGASKKDHSDKLLEVAEAADGLLFVTWPKLLNQATKLNIIDASGNILSSLEIDRTIMDNWSTIVNKLPRIDTARRTLLKQGLGFNLPSELTTLGPKAQTLRFCFIQTTEEKNSSRAKETYSSTLCSPRYSLTNKEGVLDLALNNENKPSKILIDSQPSPLTASLAVPEKSTLNFYIETQLGFTLYGRIKPSVPVFTDSYFDSNKGYFNFLGSEPLPFELQGSGPQAKEELFSFNRFWDQTIGDFRRTWHVKRPVDQLQFDFQAKGGLYFQYKITPPNDPPSLSERAFLEPNETPSTYLTEKKSSLECSSRFEH